MHVLENDIRNIHHMFSGDHLKRTKIAQPVMRRYLLYLLWILYLFHIDWLISYYIPPLNHIRALPTILTLILMVSSIESLREITKYRLLALFIASALLSTFAARNIGYSKGVVRPLVEFYMLCLLSTQTINGERLTRLMDMFLASFAFFGIWEVLTFISTKRGMVPWYWVLAEEDACGPYMGIGAAFSFYYFMAKTERARVFALLTLCLCLTGVVISFARGAFLVLIATGLYCFLLSKHKKKLALAFFIGALVIYWAASTFFPGNVFWKEIKSSSEGTNKGTGHDRKILWSVAWEEFKANPIIGVGPGNFGIAAPDFIEKITDRGDYNRYNIWGRALHNGFFQILCEQGCIGSLVFLWIIISFYKDNKHIIKTYRDKGNAMTQEAIRGSSGKGVTYMAFSLKFSMFAFLLNAFFYDIIFYSWFWILYLFNRLLYQNYIEREGVHFKKVGLSICQKGQ